MDQYTVLARSAAADLTVELFLQDNTGNVFMNDRLPLAPPPLNQFAIRDLHLDALVAGRQLQVDGQIGTLSAQAVPEPSLVFSVLASSLLLLVACRRRLYKPGQ